MTAPLLWIFLPALLALFLLILPARIRYGSSVAAALTLAGLAWKMPVDSVISLGGLQFKIAPIFPFLGREFLLSDTARPLLVTSYLLLAAWLFGAWLLGQNDRFPAFGLGIQALWIGAWAIRPFLYAILLITAATLLTVVFFSLFRPAPGAGLLRLLILQTLALPAMLFTGWLLEGVAAAPAENTTALTALLLLGSSLALLLPAFPFHIWLGQLAEEIPPYLLAFWLAVFPTGTLVFFLGFPEQFAWLRQNPASSSWLTTLGFITLLFASIQAAWQRNAARLLAWVGLAANGVLLLSLGSGVPQAAILLLLPRHFALLAIGFGLNQLASASSDTSLPALQGIGYRFPLALMLIIAGIFTLAGLPLFIAFPPYLAIWEKLTAAGILQSAAFGIGLAGLVIGALRLLAVSLLVKQKPVWQFQQRFLVLFWSLTMLLLLVLPGLYPAWLQTLVESLLRLFPHLTNT